MNRRITTLFALLALALTSFVLDAAAKDISAQLPDPDGKAPDATKPVRVYILAGQSNMVGMGNLSGASCRYSGIYLTADPAAPNGPMFIYPVANYKINTHGIYVSADPKADNGATASIYTGAYDPATDYDKAKPAKTETVAPGVVRGALPTISGPHTVVVRGFMDVPESGNYTVNPGYGGQPRGGHIYNDFRDEFQGGKVTIAATSFLRYNHPRDGVIPPRGHFTLWVEEAKIPPLDVRKK